ncbi:hypothetical protein [Microvirga sp. VF16]|uniref:hypothetical protein n=1 Tax=Microvirga sp. VF16 TaxID=2807101 RepID=UPI00193EAD63|nr:hypothetical protein [Microvirga sp. VF16]QRM35413.1 hypothetical protein JO965_44485 [Microvirga sp. VF16]
MSFGYYVQELESVASDFHYEFSHSSLARILDRLDLSKLSKFSTEERVLFLKTLVEQIPVGDEMAGGQKPSKYRILHEYDADQAVGGFEELSKAKTRQKNVIRAIDIFCEIFPGGCPWRK